MSCFRNHRRRKYVTHHELRKVIMSAIDDIITDVTAQLDKAKGEIVGKIDELEAQLNAAGTPTPETQAALDRLKAAAQALDDVVPDAPAEEPPAEGTADEPPVEEPTV